MVRCLVTLTDLQTRRAGLSASAEFLVFNTMIALFGTLKNVFGGKKGRFDPGANRPQRNTPTTETRFWMH